MESTPSTASQGAAVPPTLLRQALAALYAPAGKVCIVCLFLFYLVYVCLSCFLKLIC